jgi:hypothetical protein
MNNLYDPREKGCTPSKGKVFEKSEDTSHRFGSKDMRGDKGMTKKTTDNLAKDEALLMMMGVMYYDK